LLDSSGIMVGTAHALAGIAMVGPDGAICAKNGGPYRVRIDSVHGSGMVALTVWTLPPTRE
ncbi:MAG: hypothetical protein FWD57_06435, partial [Polyangiaceae bacterium]|nr:hypothetical protein [Polyangiaceae bacterium]